GGLTDFRTARLVGRLPVRAIVDDGGEPRGFDDRDVLGPDLRRNAYAVIDAPEVQSPHSTDLDRFSRPYIGGGQREQLQQRHGWPVAAGAGGYRGIGRVWMSLLGCLGGFARRRRRRVLRKGVDHLLRGHATHLSAGLVDHAYPFM